METQSDERLPWHEPVIFRLDVTLDTRDAGGSAGDGALGTVVDGVGT
jgi:hypothetical protein